MKHYLYSIIAILGITLSAQAAPKPKSGLPPGTAAPPLALPNLDGDVINLKQYHGKVIVLNFFAFWCNTWEKEWPSLIKLSKMRKEEKFHLICVSVDGARRRVFLRRIGGKAPFPVLMDSRGEASDSYHITHVPTVVVIDKTGIIRYAHSGYPGNRAVIAAVRKAQERYKNTRK